MNEQLFSLLEAAYKEHNEASNLSFENPDPLLIAKKYKDEKIALICALFAYGRASQIVSFLGKLDFSLLQNSETIDEKLKGFCYRFQTTSDIIALFLALEKLEKNESLYEIFLTGYKQKEFVVDGIEKVIHKIQKANPHKSDGYSFLLGNTQSGSAMKRWMMYLRWMVRDDNVDMGLWKGVNTEHLLLPLDTHTFKVASKLGLIKRKSCDLKASMEATENLKKYDQKDPVKYDFALYRIGQHDRLDEFLHHLK